MARSLWKPTFIHSQVMDSYTTSEIYVYNRATNLISTRLGWRYQIYNGTRWFPIEVTQERLGHRLGEFAPTRKRPIQKKKKIIKK